MRVSKLSCLNGPETRAYKVVKNSSVRRQIGSAPRMAPAAGEILSMGSYCWGTAGGSAVAYRGLRVASGGIINCPPPETPAVRYWLRSQKPGVLLEAFVAGLHDCWTSFVGSVNRPLAPLVCRVPW